MNSLDNQIHLVANRWECPDGTILQSKHRHDFVEYVDEQGNYYCCDGGTGYYIRTSGNLIDRCIRSTDPFELQREFFMWGSYGKDDGKQDKKYIPLRELTDLHLNAILETQEHIRGTYVEVLMLAEVEYRKVHGLTVEEKE